MTNEYIKDADDFGFFPWWFGGVEVEDLTGCEDCVEAYVFVTMVEDCGGDESCGEGEETGMGGGVEGFVVDCREGFGDCV